MDTQKIKAAISQKTADIIMQKKAESENSTLCNVGKIKDGIYCAIADGITDEIRAACFSMRCNDALESRMILSKLTIDQALETAVNQYQDIYLDACSKANHEPVSFEEFLIHGVV